jgi:hypothetical protein
MLKRKASITVALMLLALALAGPSAQARQAGRTAQLRHLQPVGSVHGNYANTPAARQMLARGYLPRDRVAYDRAKAAADARVGTRVGNGSATPNPSLAPVAFRNWTGINDTNVTPGDATGAIGPTRYVELVNDKFGIYDRVNNAALSSGTLATFTGDFSGALTDPQVIWDPGTSRFYYVVLDFATNVFAVGFSKTDTPTTASNWCKYIADYGYGTNLPDYPKLGDTADFWLIGANVFNAGGSYVRADVDWITKPPAGATCPAPSSITTGSKQNLKNADLTQAFTPVPVNQTDTSSTGWIVASKDVIGSATVIEQFKVTNVGGSASIQGTGTNVPVTSYSLPPPSAPQSGTTSKFDTLDGRLTQAVSGIDPGHGSVAGIWTQHTIQGGAGSRVRWYEVNPATHATFQSGNASSTSLFAFNGAISPDRLVLGATKAFGNSMVLGFDTSSSSTFEAVRMVSKIGAGAQSAFVLVVQSAGKNVDFSCAPVCRWGDYAGASPDPGASAGGSHGQVWLTSEFNVASTSNSNVDWRSRNFGVNP